MNFDDFINDLEKEEERGKRSENEVENTIEDFPESSVKVAEELNMPNVEKEAKQLTDDNPLNDEVNNQEIKKDFFNFEDFINKVEDEEYGKNKDAVNKLKGLTETQKNEIKEEDDNEGVNVVENLPSEKNVVENPSEKDIDEAAEESIKPKEFMGTQKEWDEMSEEGKSKYIEPEESHSLGWNIKPAPEVEGVDFNIPKFKLPNGKKISIDYSKPLASQFREILPQHENIKFEDVAKVTEKAGGKDVSIPMGSVTPGGIKHGSISIDASEGNSDFNGKSIEVAESEGSNSVNPKSTMAETINKILYSQNQENSKGSFGKVGKQSIKAGAKGSSGKLSSIKLKEKESNLLDKILLKIQKSYHDWPIENGKAHFERGIFSIRVSKDKITIKYGSYREDLLEAFAKNHPDKLQYIYEELV